MSQSEFFIRLVLATSAFAISLSVQVVNILRKRIYNTYTLYVFHEFKGENEISSNLPALRIKLGAEYGSCNVY